MLPSQPNPCLSFNWILNYLFNLQAKQHLLVYSYFKDLVSQSNFLRPIVDSSISWSKSRKTGNKLLLNETINLKCEIESSWRQLISLISKCPQMDFLTHASSNWHYEQFSWDILTKTMSQLLSSFRVLFSHFISVISHSLNNNFKYFLLKIANGSHYSLLHNV